MFFDVERFTDERAEREGEDEQHGVLGGEMAVFERQQAAECAADADEHGAQADALHDGFLKAFGQAVFEQHADRRTGEH